MFHVPAYDHPDHSTVIPNLVEKLSDSKILVRAAVVKVMLMQACFILYSGMKKI
jgi:hypothetical protein